MIIEVAVLCVMTPCGLVGCTIVSGQTSLHIEGKGKRRPPPNFPVEAKRGTRDIALLVLQTGPWSGVSGQRHTPTALPPAYRPGAHCTGGWVYTEVSRHSLGDHSLSHKSAISRTRGETYSYYPARGNPNAQFQGNC